MVFRTYTQQDVLNDSKLTAFLLNTIIENLSYIYGTEMGSEDDRNSWIDYNLKRKDDDWHAIVGFQNGSPIGFILYTVDKRILSVNDIEIILTERRNPVLMVGLLRTMVSAEEKNFDAISGYINKANETSQHNFLKYASDIAKRPNGFLFTIDRAETDKIKTRLLKKELHP